jgi:hypothetical protein
MNRLLLLIPIIACSLLAGSCVTENEDTVKTTGTTAYRSDVSDFAGFYYIEGDDGKKYYPIDLPQEFRTKEIRVRFEARELGSFPHFGIPRVELLHIEKV